MIRCRSDRRQTFASFVAAALLSVAGATRAVGQVCSVTGFNGGYGTVDVLSGSPVDTSGTIGVSCAGGTPGQSVRLCINIGPGTTAVGPSGERTLRSTGDYIAHELYANSARSTVWGSWGTTASAAYPSSGSAGVQQDVTLSSTGTGTFNYTVYARVLGNQKTKTPGTYTWAAAGPSVQTVALTGASACPTTGTTADGSGLTLTATIAAACNVSATNLNFGSSSVLTSNIDAAGAVSVQCTSSTPYTVGLDAGTGAGATVAVRKMTRSGATIDYSLYTNSSRTVVWGNTSGTDTVAGTGTGNVQSLTVYGRVPSQALPALGTYSDTIVVTVTY